MIELKDRQVEHFGRYRVTDVPGEADVKDLQPEPGEVIEAGTPINKQTARLLQADIRSYPVKAGNTINKLDFVVLSGTEYVKSSEQEKADAIALFNASAGESLEAVFSGCVKIDGVTKDQKISSLGVTANSPQDGWLEVKSKWAGEPNYAIGDTISTVRKYVGDDWLLCNGAEIDSSEYPVLSSLIDVDFNTPFKKISATSPITPEEAYSSFSGGNFVLVDSFGSIAYLNDFQGNFTLSLQQQYDSRYQPLNEIFYYDKSMLLIGQTYSTSAQTTLYKDDYTVNSQYVRSNYPDRLDYACCGNGKWLARTNSTLYSASAVSGPWTKGVSRSETLYSLRYYGGYFIACASSGNILYSTSNTGPWTSKVIASGKAINDIAYNGKMWCATTLTNEVYTCETLDGTWVLNSSASNKDIKYLSVCDDVFIGKYTEKVLLAYSTEPDKTWVFDQESGTSNSVNIMGIGNGGILASLSGKQGLYYKYLTKKTLPLNPVPSLNTFIKAR